MRSSNIFIISVLAALCGATAYAANGIRPALDPESTRCLDCHGNDIIVSQDMMICHNNEGCDHPIGIDYSFSSSRNAGLTGPSDILPKLRLPGGKIGCGTCHSPYDKNHEKLASQRDGSQPDPLLAIDNTGSALCLVCHRK